MYQCSSPISCFHWFVGKTRSFALPNEYTLDLSDLFVVWSFNVFFVSDLLADMLVWPREQAMGPGYWSYYSTLDKPLMFSIC